MYSYVWYPNVMCKASFLIRNPKAGIAGQREFIPVPCGKCAKCISNRILQWQFRLEQELKNSSSAFFVTLTYSEETVPKNPQNVNVLCPRDLSLYFKRLRKAWAKVSTIPIRYYAVGEYGSKHHRPHYHIILLNCDDLRLIQDCWGKGIVDISVLRSIKSVAYCLKYVRKDGHSVHGSPPFSRMSKGLGKSYINPDTIDYHNRTLENCVVTLKSGVIIPLPKYMKDKIYNPFARWRLTQYLQARADEKIEERVTQVLNDTNESEKNIRLALDREPFIDTFTPRLHKPTVF